MLGVLPHLVAVEAALQPLCRCHHAREAGQRPARVAANLRGIDTHMISNTSSPTCRAAARTSSATSLTDFCFCLPEILSSKLRPPDLSTTR